MKAKFQKLSLIGAIAVFGLFMTGAMVTNPGGGSTPSFDAVTAVGNSSTGNDESNPFEILGSGADTDKGWRGYYSTSGEFVFICVKTGVEGDCDQYKKLNAGKKGGFKNSSSVTGFEYDEATNKVTILQATQADDQLWVADSASAGTMRTVPDCTDTGGNHLNYTQSSNTFSCGTTASASGGATIVRKTADETVNNSAARQADDHLTFAVDANSFYTVQMYVKYSADQAADFQMDFTVPASATGHYNIITLPSSAVACTGTGPQLHGTSVVNPINGIGGAGTGSTCSFPLSAEITTAGTAGNVTFRWAQSSAHASDTKVYAGSWIRYQKL